MSYHRVLPRPLPLSNEDLANRWSLRQDSLKSASIMNMEKTDASSSKSVKPDLSPAPDGHGTVASEQVQGPAPRVNETLLENGAQTTAPALGQKIIPSKMEHWEEEIPGHICLCQPDPKVPRPRNGMCALRYQPCCHHAFSTYTVRSGADTGRSIHPLSTAPSSFYRGSKPRSTES